MAGLSVSAVIFDFYSALASAAPLMHVDANKGCLHTSPSPPLLATPCHDKPHNQSHKVSLPLIFPLLLFICLSCCSHLQNFSARISFCLFYMAVCVVCPRVASSSTPAPAPAPASLLSCCSSLAIAMPLQIRVN